MTTIFPLIVFSVLGLGALALLTMRAPREARHYITATLMVAYGLRLLLATAFDLVPSLRIFHDDASGYEGMGRLLAADWSGTGPPIDFDRPQNAGFFYFSGFIYYVFGSFRVNVSYVNALLGTVTAFLVYDLATKLFHQRVARTAMLLVAFTPSMVLWSSIAVKDTLVTLLVVLSLSSCVALKSSFTPAALLGTILPIVALQPLRFYLIYFLAFSVLVALLLDRGVRLVTGLYKQILVLGLVALLFMGAGVSSRVQGDVEFMSLERVSMFRQGMASSAASGFAHDADVSSLPKALAFLPMGMANLLFAPFPWQITSLRALLASPETIIWWFLVPATFRGLRLVVRKRLADASPLLFFAVSLTCAYSLMQGNVGTAFRQRAQIFVLLFMFTAAGLLQKKCRRAGIDETAVLANPELSEPAASQAQAAPPAVLIQGGRHPMRGHARGNVPRA